MGTGLALDGDSDRVLAIQGRPGLEGFDTVLDFGHITKPHRVAAPVADNQAGKIGGITQLLIGPQGHGLHRAVPGAHRRIDIGRAQGSGQFIESDVACGQRLRLHFNPHRIALGAKDQHLGNTVDGGQGRRYQMLGVVLQVGQRQRWRGQGNQQHRRIGRVDLAVRGRLGHVLRQTALHTQQ
ncbi:hypothetical protein GALL_441890 [mine drainage metagenome]|uniref:Uncharacterized protein n=1 Tax=mine drainage metagenome TaxID=410659 RepID=A0A1J5PRE2_9ZZZZ